VIVDLLLHKTRMLGDHVFFDDTIDTRLGDGKLTAGGVNLKKGT